MVEPDPPPAGGRVALRRDRLGDADRLLEILCEPAVARWWGRSDAAEVRDEIGSGFVILVDGGVQGWLQFREESAADYRHVAFDVALATAHQGRGLGPEALRLAVRHFAARGHHRFTVDPAAENERAIRAYGSVGFKPVGRLRAYERAPDGTWRDGLLMELLVDELRG